MEVITKRRSIRKYTDEPVKKEEILQILEAARNAPSAKNRQPWKFIVFAGDQKAKLMECMENAVLSEIENPTMPEFSYGHSDATNTVRVMKEAPVVIVVLNTNGRTPAEPLDFCGRIVEICDSLSIGAAIENMLLTATELGLGSLWIANTCFAYDALVKFLGTEAQLIGAVALGHKNHDPKTCPRKTLEEIYEFRGM